MKYIRLKGFSRFNLVLNRCLARPRSRARFRYSLVYRRQRGEYWRLKIARKTSLPAIAKWRFVWVSEGLVIRLKKRLEEGMMKIGVEIRHIVVDSLENSEVELFLRPNASLACGAPLAASKRSNYVLLQPNSGFRILRDQVDDSLM